MDGRNHILSPEFGSYDLGGLNMPTITLPSPPPYVPQGVYALEANSTNIANDYSDNYQNYIAPYLTTGCLGSSAIYGRIRCSRITTHTFLK